MRSASGWSVSVPDSADRPRNVTSEGCSAVTASPNAAAPTSGGSVTVAGRASWLPSISKRHQSSLTCTCRPNWAIIRMVRSM